jgi:two-component system, OmpR family, sensor histidine kinase KdpD
VNDDRKDPEALLDVARRAETKPRGRLKVFFGMAPGVGKTYAMLAAAQRIAAQGVDVVAGIVETHGRVETEQMLLGLDLLPRRKVEYLGTTLHEFDAEAAIIRRPDILLVDELAHTNAPGSSREKRWQDVLECVKAGVNVYTTLNVQHLESINDVVTQITGVPVRETVPDSVFDEADEVELVDLPTEVLHERLRAGKVYLGDNAVRAVDPSDGFFRKGNLTALRELALRRTAAWVDSEMRRYKQDRGIRTVWAAGERIVVAVSPSPMSGRLVRAAKRMAAGLHADLIAVYVETPRSADLSANDRERLTQNMRLAESLGATTATLVGQNAARELIVFARSRNVGKIVVGKTERPRWKELLFGSFIDNLIRESRDIDVYVVRGDDSGSGVPGQAAEPERPPNVRGRGLGLSSRSWASLTARFGGALLIVAVTSLLALAFYQPPDLSEEALILLGGIVVCAIWCGRGPATLASVLSVLAFNFFFTEPRFSLSVNDPTYLLTFSVMLSVGLIVGTLAARTREQARAAWNRERQTAALYALSRELAAAQGIGDVAAVAARHTHDLLGLDVIVAVPAHGKSTSALDVLAFGGAPDWFEDAGGRERGVAQWALDHGKPAGLGTQKLPASAGRYVPLVGTSGKLGILGLHPVQDHASTEPVRAFDASSLLLIEAMTSQIASALERVSLSESQQAAKLEVERERLRNALLSSVSHDLRTPLASITGAASTLEQSAGTKEPDGGGPASQGLDEGTRASLLRTIIDESSRLNDIIANLVFATRLESGTIALNREWTTLEEIIGVGLARHRVDLASRPFRVNLPTDLPMIRVDNAMLPQVVHNLIENALRYTPALTPISVGAWTTDGQVVVKVADEGPGLADDEAAKVFQRFYRGRASKSASGAVGTSLPSTGMGLGLTICEGIIRAHGGRIWAEPNTPKGVAFMFSLPIEQPQPSMPSELTDRTHAQEGAV